MKELIDLLVVGFSIIGALIFGVILMLDLKFLILIDLVNDIRNQIKKGEEQ